MAAPATVNSELTPTLCHWLRTRRAGKAVATDCDLRARRPAVTGRAVCSGRGAPEEGQPERRPHRHRSSWALHPCIPFIAEGETVSMHIMEGYLPPSTLGLDGRRGAVRGGGRAPDRAHYRGSSRSQASARNIGGLRLRAVGAEDSVRYGELFASYRGGAGGGPVRAECDGGAGKIVLLFQALLLAHGGITTLGANAFSMAIVGPWVAWGVWRLTSGFGGVSVCSWRRRWGIWRLIA